MHPPNVKTKALLLLLCVLAMNGSAMVVPSLARDAAQAKSVGSLHIDPGLLKAMEGGNADKAIPVIVTFNERTIVADRHAFLHAMEGSSFVLKHTYSIIPGISGSIRSSDLGTLKALSAHVSFRVCENTNYSIQMVTRTSSTGIEASHIEASQATSWWLDLIGRNQTIVQSLNLSTIKVGVLDTGIGFKRNGEYAVHADLAGSIGGSVNLATGTALGDVYDNYGHGTHVAGIIAGSGASSSNKYVGVAPGVKIYNIKVLNETGSGFEDDIIKGIEYAVNESLDIINLSLGGGNPDPLDPESMAVKNATAQGLLVVIANGNDGSGYFTVSSPAAADGCIAVGAIDQLKDVTSFSSRGPSMGRIFKPDVVAPGENIVAALGNNSFLQKYYGYFKLTLSGTTNANNDYVALDGTSMATPMVAGAAALILAKYRPYHLAPALVAASLLESAVDLGYDASTQGMGLINVTRALSFLESIKASNNLTSLARIYPKKLPYAPYDVISFPGQESTMMVKVLHHGAQSIHFDASAIPAGMQLAISPNTTTLNSAAGATFFNVSISTSFDAMPGNYSVDLVLKNASDAALDAIEIRFTLRVPRLRAYLDTYHSLEDMFPHGFPLARFAMDYYPYIKHLASEGIQVDASMEYWTADYNASEQRTPLVDSLLCNYDVVILPPLKTPLFDVEIEALSRFHQGGGHIIMLGARKQELSIAGANAVLAALGMDASFTSTNVEIIRDNGWDHKLVDFYITNINSSNVLGTNVTRLAWFSGCTIDNRDPRAPGLALSPGGNTVLAVLPAMGRNGSVLVSGSESILPVTGESSTSVHNTRFFDNYFAYVMSAMGSIRIDSFIEPGIVHDEPTLQAFFRVSNTTSGVHYVPANLTAASCTVSNASGELFQVGLGSLTNGWFGNTTVGLSTLGYSAQPYWLTLNVTIGARQVIKRAAFFKVDRSAAVQVVASIIFSGFRGSNVTALFNGTVQNETALLSGNPTDIFSTKTVVSSTSSVAGTASLAMPITTAMPSGIYMLTFMHATRSDLYPFETRQRAMFFVDNREPSINTNRTSFDGTTVDQADLGNGLVRVISARAGVPLKAIVAGSDNESNIAQLSAFAVFYPICIIDGTAHIIPYGAQPIMSVLPYNAGAGNYQGTITIPAAVTFTVGTEQVTRPFTSWGDFMGAVLVILRDGDGALDVEVFFINLVSATPIDLTWLLVLGIAAGVIGLVGVILNRRLRGWRGSKQPARAMFRDTYEPDVIDNRRKMRYCPYCAAEIRVRTRYCPYCGECIDFT